MGKKDELNLFRPFDEKGQLLWTAVPNCLLSLIMDGAYKNNEAKVLLFICRMTYGFRREDSNYLGLDDFEKMTGLKKPHVSKAINNLLSDYTIFRHTKNGNKFKYAINLLSHGVKMKHYRKGRVDDKIDDAVYENQSLNYELSNYKGSINDLILYSIKSYENSKKLYIKIDTNSDIKKDNTAVATFKSSNKSNNSLQQKSISIQLQKEQEMYKKYSDFRKNFVATLSENNTIDALMKQMRLYRVTFPTAHPNEITSLYHSHFCVTNMQCRTILREAKERYTLEYKEKWPD